MSICRRMLNSWSGSYHRSSSGGSALSSCKRQIRRRNQLARGDCTSKSINSMLRSRMSCPRRPKGCFRSWARHSSFRFSTKRISCKPFRRKRPIRRNRKRMIKLPRRMIFLLRHGNYLTYSVMASFSWSRPGVASRLQGSMKKNFGKKRPNKRAKIRTKMEKAQMNKLKNLIPTNRYNKAIQRGSYPCSVRLWYHKSKPECASWLPNRFKRSKNQRKKLKRRKSKLQTTSSQRRKRRIL